MIKRWISRFRRNLDYRREAKLLPPITPYQWQLYLIDRNYRDKRPWVYSNYNYNNGGK